MSQNPAGYCQACFKRIGKRRNPCSFCGNCDFEAPKQPPDAPSVGLVPLQVYLPRDVYESVKARTVALSMQGEQTHSMSELIAGTMRRALSG